MLSDWKNEQKLITRISDSIKCGHISHAYIIEGDLNCDKETFARDFLKAVLCREKPGEGCGECISCRKIDHDNMEDLYYVRAEAAAGRSVSSIKDADMEELQKNLKMKPLGERNMAIICDADTMTVRAQNRFLKTLEEPTEGTIIILLSENSDNLLQTIRSRCITYRLYSSDMGGEKVEITELCDAIISHKDFFTVKNLLLKEVKSRDDGVKTLEKLEDIYREIMLGSNKDYRFVSTANSIAALKLIEETKKSIKGAGNYNYILKKLILDIRQNA